MMKEIIEQQEKEFVKKYNSSVLLAYPEYAESHMILLTDIWNWHKQSLKQFIDGLVEKNNENKMEEFHDCARHPLGDCECIGKWVGNNMAVNKMNLHLKEIRNNL